MWKVAASVLHCGNIKFDPNGADACTISSKAKTSVKNFAELIGVNEASLSKTLVQREITLRGETVRSWNIVLDDDCNHQIFIL